MRIVVVLGSILLGVVWATGAGAATLTVAFRGTVDRVEDPLGLLANRIVPGTVFRGSYVFDRTVGDVDDAPTSGAYPVTGPLFSIAFADFRPATAEAAGEGSAIFVENTPVADRYRVVAESARGFAFPGNDPQVLPLPLAGVVLALSDPTGTAFDSDALPAGAPDLSRFRERLLTVASLPVPGSFQGFTILGTIDALSVVPEPPPLPASLLALLAGGTALFSRGRR